MEMGREKVCRGELEFGVIVDGELKETVFDGLLAYYDEVEDGVEIITQKFDPVFMVNVVKALTDILIKHDFGDLLIGSLVESMEDKND